MLDSVPGPPAPSCTSVHWSSAMRPPAVPPSPTCWQHSPHSPHLTLVPSAVPPSPTCWQRSPHPPNLTPLPHHLPNTPQGTERAVSLRMMAPSAVCTWVGMWPPSVGLPVAAGGWGSGWGGQRADGAVGEGGSGYGGQRVGGWGSRGNSLQRVGGGSAGSNLSGMAPPGHPEHLLVQAAVGGPAAGGAADAAKNLLRTHQ